MNFSAVSDALPDRVRKRYRLCAYASTWVGCFSDVMLENSAVLLLYLAMLNAGDTLIMLSTGLVGIASMFLLIPASGIVGRIGLKRSVAISSAMGGGAYLLMAAAPVFGDDAARYAVFAGCFLFSLSKPLNNAAWYPICGAILKPDERGDFFGFMRFSYYILTGGVFFLLGVFMGPRPPLSLLQIVIAATGILALGRYYFISRIELPAPGHGNYEIGRAFAISVRNGPLVGFSVYVCFLSLAFAAVLPLALLYLRNGLHFGDNVVQMLSSVGIGGCVCGFFFYSRIVRRFGIRNVQVAIHLAYIFIPLGLFTCTGNGIWTAAAAGFLLFAGNFVFACFGCAFSQELLALARPGNTTMATAFGQTYQMIGTACGRVAASLLLAHGVLNAVWTLGSFSITRFQTVFLLCAGMALISLILIFCIPSVVPKHRDYYRP